MVLVAWVVGLTVPLVEAGSEDGAMDDGFFLVDRWDLLGFMASRSKSDGSLPNAGTTDRAYWCSRLLLPCHSSGSHPLFSLELDSVLQFLDDDDFLEVHDEDKRRHDR